MQMRDVVRKYAHIVPEVKSQLAHKGTSRIAEP
jgi:hypothetical protein